MTTEVTDSDATPPSTDADDTAAEIHDTSIDRIPGRIAAAVLLVCGIIGLISAATLTIERYKLFIDPNYRPSCSINPVLSCGSVMTTHQAAFFGFPNPIIGVAAFAVPIVLALLALARTPIPAWVWAGLSLGLAAGMVFIGYLITQSIYRINALCPYCMVVWTITPLMLVIAIGMTARASGNRRIVGWAAWLWPLLVIYYAIVIMLIAVHFWYYWSTLL